MEKGGENNLNWSQRRSFHDCSGGSGSGEKVHQWKKTDNNKAITPHKGEPTSLKKPVKEGESQRERVTPLTESQKNRDIISE